MGRPVVLGVDPSLSGTGLCWADGSHSTCGGSGDQRLWVIYRTIRSLCAEHRPALAVVEDLPTHAMGAGKTGMAQGAVRLALMAAEVPYAMVPAALVKKYATGSGNATKPDMRMALFARFGVDLRDEDQVDAWWLRAIGMDYLAAPVVDVPKANRAALGKVEWPVLAEVAW